MTGATWDTRLRNVVGRDAKKLEEAAFLVTRELRLRRPAAALVREWHLHRGRHKPETG